MFRRVNAAFTVLAPTTMPLAALPGDAGDELQMQGLRQVEFDYSA